MNKIFTFLLVILLCNIAFSQCGSGNIILRTQADVDNFSVNYPDCHRILGDIEIIGTNIENLDGLSVIDSIDQSLTIQNNLDLYSIDGLKNLETIQDLILENCPLIEDLNAFQSLQQATNGLSLGTLNIRNLQGLEHVKFIRQFSVYDNLKLENLSGIDSLKKALTFSILRNPVLQNLNGINPDIEISQFYLSENDNLLKLTDLNLEQLYSLDLRSNPKLEDISGLSNINKFWFLNIFRNGNLKNLKGFENLTTINFHLKIDENNLLEDITSLKNVLASTPDSIFIRKNPNLTICNNEFICKYLEDSLSKATILDNKSGCSTRREVEQSCLKTSVYNNSLSIEVYPNPARDLIIIKGIKGNAKVEIYNSIGQEVYSSFTDQSLIKIDCTLFPEGNYFLKINETEYSKVAITK